MALTYVTPINFLFLKNHKHVYIFCLLDIEKLTVVASGKELDNYVLFLFFKRAEHGVWTQRALFL